MKWIHFISLLFTYIPDPQTFHYVLNFTDPSFHVFHVRENFSDDISV
jgi:hypothetical protein